MEQHENIALAGYRLEKVKNDLRDAQKNIEVEIEKYLNDKIKE